MDSMVAQAGSLPRSSGTGALRSGATAGGTSRMGSAAPDTDADADAEGEREERTPAPTQPKRKMKITYDQYVSMQTLILLKLADRERTTGTGMSRDELITWYLEHNESEIDTVEELEYQTELIGKVLNKLVKVRIIISIRSSRVPRPQGTAHVYDSTSDIVQSSHIRTTHCWRCAATSTIHYPPTTMLWKSTTQLYTTWCTPPLTLTSAPLRIRVFCLSVVLCTLCGLASGLSSYSPATVCIPLVVI